MKYYSLQRPVDIGTVPRSAKIIEVHNFDERKYCKEVERLAWGWVKVKGELSKEDCQHYDLAPSGEIPWIGVIWTESPVKGIVVHGHHCTTIADRSEKPESTQMLRREKVTHLDYFENREAIDRFFEQKKAERSDAA